MKFSKGFTIIELIISIFILSIAIIGVFSALSVITILTSDTADRLTATYLAQEGMEIVRNIRDTNWINMDSAANGTIAYSWTDGLTGYSAVQPKNCEDTDKSNCYADYTSTFLSTGGGDGNYLKINQNGFYNYASGTSTKFERKFIVDSVTDIDGSAPPNKPYHIIKVKAEVSWDKKATVLTSGVPADSCCPYNGDTDNCPANVANCILVEEELYDWYNINISVVSVAITDQYNTDFINNNSVALDVNNISNPKTDQLTANITPTYATNKGVSWFTGVCSTTTNRPCASDASCPAGETCASSSNFISVDQNGLVTAVSQGNNIPVTAITSDGSKTNTVYFNVINSAP